MLTRLDHIVLICREIDQAVCDYRKIFGRAPSFRSSDNEAGMESALFTCQNTALEIVAPSGKGVAANRISALLGKHEAVITSLVFETDNIGQARHVLSRRGLKPTEISRGESTSLKSGAHRSWQRFRCADDICAGVKTFVLENESKIPVLQEGAAGGVQHLDHLVINTSHPERAAAHYGARLGLRFALDRTIEKFQTRFLFFRIGGLTLEVTHRLGENRDPDDQDIIWGLTWDVNDLETEHGRLRAHNLDVSDIKPGRKPGSRVFTLRSGSLGIPTLFIAHETTTP